MSWRGLAPLGIPSIFVLLSACSFSGIGEPIIDPLPDANDISEAYETIHALYPGLKLSGNPEASPVHKVRSGYLADWAMCVRNDDPSKRRHYTFYFRNRKLVDWRLSAIVEQCETQTYALLPPPKPKLICDEDGKARGLVETVSSTGIGSASRPSLCKRSSAGL